MQRNRPEPLILSVFVCLVVAGCSHDGGQSDNAAKIGITKDLDQRMMRTSPLYRSLMTNNVGYKEETQEFFERIKSVRKPEDLQTWALEVLKNHRDKNEPFYLDRREIPDSILHLDPPLEPFVIVNPRSSVTVAWGGGFGLWGLYLADSNSVCREDRSVYVLDWAPGVQVFHDIQ